MLPWPPLQGRCVDGAPPFEFTSAPTSSLSSSLMSANRRLTEPREIGPLAQASSDLPAHVRNMDTYALTH